MDQDPRADWEARSEAQDWVEEEPRRGVVVAGPFGTPADGPSGQAAPARRLNLFAPVAPIADDAARPAEPPVAEAAAPATDEILSRLDELSRLLVRRDAGRVDASQGRIAEMEALLDGLMRRQDAEVTSLRESLAARLAAVEAAQAKALADAEGRLAATLAMQGQLIEALVSEKERTDTALTLLEGGLAAAVSDGEALERALDARFEAIEGAVAAGSESLDAALSDCAARLDEVLFHLETSAVDHLPGGGRPIRAALQVLSDQIGGIDARLRAMDGAARAPVGPRAVDEFDEPVAPDPVGTADAAEDSLRRLLAGALGDGAGGSPASAA